MEIDPQTKIYDGLFEYFDMLRNKHDYIEVFDFSTVTVANTKTNYLLFVNDIDRSVSLSVLKLYRSLNDLESCRIKSTSKSRVRDGFKFYNSNGYIAYKHLTVEDFLTQPENENIMNDSLFNLDLLC
jgi:hypothetical protein